MDTNQINTSRMPKPISIVTFVCGIVVLLFRLHIKTDLPASGDQLSANGVEDLFVGAKLLVSALIPGMAAYLMFLSVVLWIHSRKK